MSHHLPVLATLILFVVALASCAEKVAPECAADQVCPPFTLCGPGGTCPAEPTECARFDDGTPCAAGDRSLCQQGECLPSICGDSFFDEQNGESCDLGDANSSVPDAECRPDCSARRCGDGTIDSDEVCDSGDANSDVTPNECRTSCDTPSCGDAVRDRGEDQGCFGIFTRYETGSTPTHLALGDFDGDGLVDVVTSNSGSDDHSIFLGRPDGSFADESRFSTGLGLPQGLVAGDFDGDGQDDLAVVNRTDDTLSVMFGGDGGSFASSNRYATGAGPVSVAAGHLDDDDLLDLVVVNEDSGDLGVYEGLGDGSFNERGRLPLGVGVNFVALGDLDGNGDPDAVVSNDASDSIVVLADVGLLELAPEPRIYDVGEGPRSIVVEDLDLDGLADVAVANSRGQDLSILRNLGGGLLSPQQRVATVSPPRSVAAGLLDDDNVPDLVVGLATDTLNNKLSLEVLRGAAGGGFISASQTALPEAPIGNAVAVSDLNHDGRPDAVFAAPRPSGVFTVLGGDGTLGRRFAYDAGEIPWVGRTGDLNRDGNLDVFVVDRGAGAVKYYAGTGLGGLATPVDLIVGEDIRDIEVFDVNYDTHQDLLAMDATTGELIVMFGDSSGAVTPGGRYQLSEANSTFVMAIDDLDRDGVIDVVVGGSADTTLHILRGRADGTFEEERVFEGWAENTVVLLLEDMDGDDIPDIIVSSSTRVCAVFRGRGDATFDTVPYYMEAGGRNTAVGDITGDGRPDLVRFDPDTRVLTLVDNRGDEGLAILSQATIGPALRFMDVLDLNGDGVQDIIGLDSADGKVVVYLGRNAATLGEPQTFESGADPRYLFSGDMNGDGVPDVGTVGAELSIFIGHATPEGE